MGWNEYRYGFESPDSELDNLELFDVINDRDQDYSFDDFYVFKHKITGALYYCQDAGCSCPGPLEWVTNIDDLTKLVGLDAFQQELKGWCTYSNWNELGVHKNQLLAKVVGYYYESENYAGRRK